MTDTKTLAERLRGLSDYLIHAGEDEASSLVDQAADALERITPPDAGVGLKRYVIGAVMLKGELALFTCEGPVGPDEGEWVRYEAAEARCDTLAGALRDAKDNGLIYWEPNTQRGHVAKAQMLARIDAALNGQPAVNQSRRDRRIADPTPAMIEAGLIALIQKIEEFSPPLPPDTPENAFRRGLIIGAGSGRSGHEIRAVWKAMAAFLSPATDKGGE